MPFLGRLSLWVMREIIFYSEVRIKLEMFVGDDKKKKKKKKKF